MIVEKITRYLEANEVDVREDLLTLAASRFSGVVRRQFMAEREAKAFRLMPSNVGKCPRALSFYAHGHARGDFPARTRIKFYLGDLAELGLVVLAELAGCPILECQREVQTDVGRGFVDGMYVGEHDIRRVVEVKSMTDRAFQEFEKNGLQDTWGYVAQCQVYMRALDVNETIALALNTNTGHIAEAIVYRNDDAYVPALNLRKRAIETPPLEVSRPEWAIQGARWMPRNKVFEITDCRCRYCDCVEACWPGVDTKITSKGPSYRVKGV